MSALSFAWRQSTNIRVRPSSGAADEASGTFKSDWRTYEIDGPLFFGSTQTFSAQFSPKDDPGDVVLDFSESRVMDHSALEAINTLCERYGALGKRVHLRRLSSDCYGLLERLNGELPPYEIIEADRTRDPVYEVAEESPLYSTVPVPKPWSYQPAKPLFCGAGRGAGGCKPSMFVPAGYAALLCVC